LWGRLGDLLGRKRIPRDNDRDHSTATNAVGQSPGHATIGIAAPALLLLLRMIQSLSAASECAGRPRFVAEELLDRY